MITRTFCSERYLRLIGLLVLTVQTLFFLIDMAISCSTHSLCVSIFSLEGHFCSNISTVIIAQSAVSVLMDFGVLSIPIYYIVWRLRMSWAKKQKLTAIFFSGFM